MPRLGMTMLEGTVVRWLQDNGAAVQKGDVILEVETDKVVQEIEATGAGLLKQAADVGESVQIGRPLAYILAEGEVPPVIEPKTTIARPAATKTTPRQGRPQARGAPMRATPIARRVAAEHGIDLESLQGSGPGGRITEADVKAAVEAKPAEDDRAVKERVPLQGVRAATARHMAAATAIPQVTLNRECGAGALVHLRSDLISPESEIGVRVSYNAIIVAVLAKALVEHPALNAALSDGAVTIFEDINIGVAVETERGLLVPVLRNADDRLIPELATELEKLVEGAIQATLGPDDLSGGTATITNLGAYGVDYFNPILNSPESVILGVGRIRDRGNGDATMWLSLTFDHRVADGAQAARLLDRIAVLIESSDHLASLA